MWLEKWNECFQLEGMFLNNIWLPVILQKKSETILEEQVIKVVDWPGNSPNMKPIENLWRIFKTKCVGNDCTTLTQPMEPLDCCHMVTAMKYCSRLPKLCGINAKAC